MESSCLHLIICLKQFKKKIFYTKFFAIRQNTPKNMSFFYKSKLFLAKSLPVVTSRNLNCQGDTQELSGLVLGVYSKDDDPYGTTKIWTKASEELDKKLNGALGSTLAHSGPVPRLGEVRLFYRLENLYTAIAMVGLGDECLGYNDFEMIDEGKEAIRNAAAVGAQALQAQHMRTIDVEALGHAESSAEGAAMGVWMYQELRSKQKYIPKLELYGDCDFTGWQIGLQKAAAQNLTRQLAETPANIMTPTGFSQAAVELLTKGGVSVEVKVRDWAFIMNMPAFLLAAKGSCEPPVFLEIHYYGCDFDVAPVVAIGKGVTFDSGGLCLKECEVQKTMRGDMSGAASVIATARAIAALRLPINFRGLIPLYENLPGSCAFKPGDIVRTRNGKTVMVQDTDFDGRLAVADALSYAANHNPKFIYTQGSFTKELVDTFGEGAIAAFSNNDILYDTLKLASIHTGDRVWRLPLWKHYSNKITDSDFSDIKDRHEDVHLPSRLTDTGMPGQTAAFLYQFVPNVDWVHLDTYNVTLTDGYIQRYLVPGMSGRPTRTLIEFLAQAACMSDIEANPNSDQVEKSSKCSV